MGRPKPQVAKNKQTILLDIKTKANNNQTQNKAIWKTGTLLKSLPTQRHAVMIIIWPCDNSPGYGAPVSWNNLQKELKLSEMVTLGEFKSNFRRTREYLF